jgi:succinoglycan biosynthesis transport protein ExoP
MPSPNDKFTMYRARRLPLRSLLLTLNRRKWLLVSTSLITTLIAAAALSLVPPEYTSTVRLAIDPASGAANQTTLLAKIETAEFLNKVDERHILQQPAPLGAATSPLFEEAWLWINLQLSSFLGTSPPPTASDTDEARLSDKAKKIRAMLSITPTTDNTVTISVQATERRHAKRTADTLALLYVEETLRAEQDSNNSAAARTVEQLTFMKHSADAASNAVAKFRTQAGLSSGPNDQAVAQALATAMFALGQIQAEIIDRRTRIASLQDFRGATSDALNSPVIAAMRVQEAEAARRVAEISQRYGELHPRVVQAKAELAQVRGAIAAEVKKIANSLDTELTAAQAKEKRLQDQVVDLKQKVSSLEQNEIELKQLERIAEKEDAAYRELLRRTNERRAEQTVHPPIVRILAPASLPDAPSYPQYGNVLAIALITGLIVGLAWSWLMESLDSGFRTGAQIEAQTGHILVGMVPALARSTLKKSTPIRFAIENPTSVYAEALRSVQTSISLSSSGPTPRVIMITSSVPGEGKSTFSCSLACLVARSRPNQRVVLVDCSGTRTLSEILSRENESGLFYLAARSNTENSAELLASDKMQTLMDELRDAFDLVFLDTPPLMAISDPRVLVPFADYIVFLIQWEKTERDLAAVALNLLPADARTGVVLSQVNLRRHAQYGYADNGAYYSKYSSYYSRF